MFFSAPWTSADHGFGFREPEQRLVPVHHIGVGQVLQPLPDVRRFTGSAGGGKQPCVIAHGHGGSVYQQHVGIDHVFKKFAQKRNGFMVSFVADRGKILPCPDLPVDILRSDPDFVIRDVGSAISGVQIIEPGRNRTDFDIQTGDTDGKAVFVDLTGNRYDGRIHSKHPYESRVSRIAFTSSLALASSI